MALDSHTPQGPPARHKPLKEKAIEQGRRFLVMFLYLWAIFALFALHERIVLRQLDASLPSQGFALVNALVLAKVMLVAEDLNFGGWLRSRRLIWPILHKALLFAILFIAVHYLEGVLTGWFRGYTLMASVPAVGGGGIAGLLCTAILMFVALIPFFAFRDVNQALGDNRLVEMVLGSRTNRTAGSP